MSELLGVGSTSCVYKSDNKYVRKVFNETISEEFIKNEGEIQQSLIHENIISVYEITPRMLVLEYVPLGMTEIRCWKNKIPIHIIKDIIYQLLLVCKFIHSKGIVHCDIKLENLFMTESGKLKLGDFGCARKVRSNNAQVVGTWSYCPMEVLLGSTLITYSIDVWGVGCVMSELFIRRRIFSGDSREDALKSVRENYEKIFKQDIPDVALSLLGGLLKINVEESISIDVAITHEFLVQNY